ncbi:MAG: endonuclease III [Nanoarchaeota archaeon]
MEKEKANKILQILKKEYPHAKYYLNFSSPLELLVAAILSAQCRDEVVNATTPNLFKKYKAAKSYAEADLRELIKDIRTISFAGNKAKFIKNACKILVEKYNGKVPNTIEELVKLPGIGRKTATTILVNAYGIVLGISVDTHVIRLSQRTGLSKNKNPDKIEKYLMELYDKKEWKKLPYILKAHGRAICQAPIPYCSKCVIKNLCPKQGVTKHY